MFHLDDRYWIWDWLDDNTDIKTTIVYYIYEYILSEIKSAKAFKRGLFHIDLEDEEIDKSIINSNPIIPIIYQPAVDSLQNFVRQVHCARIDLHTLEITIIFNNEHLRQHHILNEFYEGIRNLIYHRIEDVETFRIYNDKSIEDIDNNVFIFDNSVDLLTYNDKIKIKQKVFYIISRSVHLR